VSQVLIVLLPDGYAQCLNLKTMQPSGNKISDPTTTDEYILVINGKPEGPFSIAATAGA
jgi:hypothetical protein